MKDLRPISIISSISPCNSRRVPLKALMIIALGLIRDVSTFRHSIVAIGQTFKANRLLIITLVTIKFSQLTIICIAKV